MRAYRFSVLGLSVLVLASVLPACGGGTPKASKTPAEEETAKADDKPRPAKQKKTEDSAEESSGIPTKCAGSGQACTPPVKFVKKLCADAYPGVAIYMFQKGSVWTRGYLTRKTEAVNASGGKSGEGYLEFDEEVLVMRKLAADYGGMQVSGAMGGWDVLRWDGTCATLAAEELTLNRSPSPKAAKVLFRFLDDNIKEALRKDSKLDEVYLAHRKECKGATTGEVSKKCETLDKKFADTIVQVVKGGIEIPVPDKLP